MHVARCRDCNPACFETMVGDPVPLLGVRVALFSSAEGEVE